MAVKIIKETERNSVVIEGSTFYYRRISVSKSMEINKRHTRRGVVDYAAAGLDVVKYCLLGWDEVLDENDEPIEYDPALVDMIPDNIIGELSEHFRESSPVRQNLGN